MTEQNNVIRTQKGELMHITPGKLDKYNHHSGIIILSAVDGEPIANLVRQEAQRKYKECQEKGEKIAGWATPPFTELDDGRFEFKFSENKMGGPKDNPEKQFTRKIGYLDAGLNPWPEGVLVGNGSIGKISFVLWSWNVTAKNGVGVTIKIRGVQIINLVPYIPEQKTHGFSQEEGTDMSEHGFGSEPAHAGSNGNAPAENAPVQDDIPY